MLIQVCYFSVKVYFDFTYRTRFEDNPLQTAVLNLFITMKYRFPNLVVGMLTRESVRKALSNGISAEQVSEFRRVWIMSLIAVDRSSAT
jgi:hypothetical protein